jgi:DNA-binding beta-propeller fold protein YncE
MGLMRARRLVLAVVVWLCVVVGGLVLGGVSAFALSTHVFGGSFGGEGVGNGQFKEPSGVAVNAATHDVYVVDRGNNRVELFSSAGVYVSQFDGSAAPSGVFSAPSAIAVDNSGNPLDPSAGDVYVVDTGHNVIDKFSSAGTYIGQLSETTGGASFGELFGVAVDTNGVVWVYQASGEIDSFSDALGNVYLSSRVSPFGTSPGFAVDSADDLYVDRGSSHFAKLSSSGEVLIENLEGEASTGAAVDVSSGEVFIENETTVGTFDSSGGLLARFGAGHLTRGSGIAVDPAGSTVYVADSTADVVGVFSAAVLPDVSTGAASGVHPTSATLNGVVNPDGIQLTDCHFEYGTDTSYGQSVPCVPAAGSIPADSSEHAVSAELTGLVPGGSYHYRLVASNASGINVGSDVIFQTPPPPSIDSAAVTNVTGSSADLTARINPNGLDTTYHFEWGASTAYDTSVPLSAADIGAGSADVSVSTRLSGLSAGTVYHWRVLATNESGTTSSGDHTFTPYASVGGGLPDNRAYELVSPVDKSDGSIDGGTSSSVWESSVDGSRMAFSSSHAFADAQTGSYEVQPYVASRGAEGWSTHAQVDPVSFSSDLSKTVVRESPSARESRKEDLLVGGIGSSLGLYQRVNVTPPGVALGLTTFEGASADLSHVVFEETAQLTADAPEGEIPSLYEWVGGVLRLVSVLPDGAAMGGGGSAHFVSEDGSRIVFNGSLGLYLREGGVRTVQVDASQGPGTGGRGLFQAASSDGSRIFFTDDPGLTSDSVPGSGKNLYEYDVADGRLTDLTSAVQVEIAGSTESNGEGVFGVSSDGSYVYFVATGSLASGATAGQPNLYVWHEGTTTFITTLEKGEHGEGDSLDWLSTSQSSSVRVSQDGSHVAFNSLRSLTGYDNTDVNTGKADTEVFVYDALTKRLVCASCNPSGASPTGPTVLSAGATRLSTGLSRPFYRPRFLSADGSRLFFNSPDALVPQDTNGKEDVYEYENGRVYLISSGTSREDSFFLDASASGNDVFFRTTQQLVPQDRDPRFDVYDARVGGGFPPPVSSVACSGEDCRPAPVMSVLGVPGSAVFSGAGNLVPSPQAPVAKAKKPKRKAKGKRRRAKHGRGKRSVRGARRVARGHSTGKRG